MTSPSQPDPAWQRLGEMLIKRRVDIDARYRNRRIFCADTDTDYRVISDIESARRTNFSQPMISHLETAYRLKAGNIKRMVLGGELDPADPVARVGRVALHVPDAGTPGVRIEQVDDSHLQVGLMIETDVTMDEVYERLGDLSPNEESMIGNMKALDLPPAEIGGTIVMLRRFKARQAGQQDDRPRRRA